ncbi:lactonase family protein, partial [Cysteiniphilum litorale]|uniref:lactonase family protein n=1 Tax=Cysteiniphilum litorale TaxID=2056700 RepID=UPI003F881F8A
MRKLLTQHVKTIFAFTLCCQFISSNEVYVGTYTEWGTPPGHGIYHFNISDTGQTSPITLATHGDDKCLNPTYLLKDHDLIYSTNELESGQITTYQSNINKTLSKITLSSSKLANPVHALKSKLYPVMIVANYGNAAGEESGISLLHINNDSTLDAKPLQVIPYHDHSIDPERQSGSHVHGIESTVIHGIEYVFVCDLGGDTITVYRLDGSTHELVLLSVIKTIAGAGPRHALMSPNKRYLYVVNELNSSISVFKFDVNAGRLTYISSQPTTLSSPQNSSERNYPAELVLSKNSTKHDYYLYVSNRGINSIAKFKLKQNEEMLKLQNEYDAFGNYPRDLAIDNTGEYLVAANQLSNNISIFKIDHGGALDFLQHVDVNSPVTVTF